MSTNSYARSGFVKLADGTLWYEELESNSKTSSATPLIIISGGPGFPHNYMRSLIDLQNDMPVIFYDQIGTGKSSQTIRKKEDWVLPKFVEDLEQLVVNLKLKKFKILGHSWGGTLALAYASKHPELVESLVLASPLVNAAIWQQDAARLLKTLPESVQKAITENEKHGTTTNPEYIAANREYYQNFICRLKDKPKIISESFANGNMEMYHTMIGSSEFELTGNLRDLDLMEQLTKLTMPVLITVGRYDGSTPESAQKFLKKLKNGKLEVFEKSSHVPHLEETETYLHSLRAFLGTRSGGGF